MFTLLLCCGIQPPSGVRADEIRPLPAVPGRRDLQFLDAITERFVVSVPKSLEELARSPEVAHQGEPAPAPHRTSEPVRAVVLGTDAALAAVATKLMRIDAMWVELGYAPVEAGSSIATVWGLQGFAGGGAGGVTGARIGGGRDGLDFALTAPAKPTAVIRDDHGVVTLGAAEVTGLGEHPLVGEVIVDSEVLYSHAENSRAGGRRGAERGAAPGVRMVPTTGRPGLAAVQLPPRPLRGLFGRWRAPVTPSYAPTVLQGRALQAGGQEIRLVRDGVEHPRPLKAVTFYRHLRDGHFVRN
ncbi:hypothetical protein [Corynebacterium heidelbergense]|uniref:Uncharacterized protein n=1 Tax=Corynebacterium heidelbergense TaxID=2055947 RepID=A0A364VC42_9CORY|nr:hypothetical protein [Corynebacterium heidelbergense]RAV34222.1 hypothetical protein CWC39_04510 [Corynebacterium heidelbergense]WCZ35811.1 hypothetical protein CHEID_01165 [Corynebacterium heidelbergense]